MPELHGNGWYHKAPGENAIHSIWWLHHSRLLNRLVSRDLRFYVMSANTFILNAVSKIRAPLISEDVSLMRSKTPASAKGMKGSENKSN